MPTVPGTNLDYPDRQGGGGAESFGFSVCSKEEDEPTEGKGGSTSLAWPAMLTFPDGAVLTACTFAFRLANLSSAMRNAFHSGAST